MKLGFALPLDRQTDGSSYPTVVAAFARAGLTAHSANDTHLRSSLMSISRWALSGNAATPVNDLPYAFDRCATFGQSLSAGIRPIHGLP